MSLFLGSFFELLLVVAVIGTAVVLLSSDTRCARSARCHLAEVGSRLVPVGDKPIEDLVAEEGELAATRLAVCGDDPFSNPGSNDLFVGVQELGKVFGVHHGWHLGIPVLVLDLMHFLFVARRLGLFFGWCCVAGSESRHGGEDFFSEEPELLSPPDRGEVASVDLVSDVANGGVHHLGDVGGGEDWGIVAADFVEEFLWQVWLRHCVDVTEG